MQRRGGGCTSIDECYGLRDNTMANTPTRVYSRGDGDLDLMLPALRVIPLWLLRSKLLRKAENTCNTNTS